MLAKPLAVTSASLLYNLHILIVRIPLGKLSCWLSSHNRASRLWLVIYKIGPKQKDTGSRYISYVQLQDARVFNMVSMYESMYVWEHL